MPEIELYADIILPFPLKQDYTYRVPPELEQETKVGKRVIVQFGPRRLYTGIIRKIHSLTPGYANIKNIVSLLDEKALVDNIQLEFWDWMAEYYMCSAGEVFKSALPSGLKLESESLLIPNNDFDKSLLKEKFLLLLFESIKNNPGISIRELSKLSSKENILKEIRKLIDVDAAFLEEKLRDSIRIKKEAFLILNSELNPEWKSKLKKAPKQLEALEVIIRKFPSEVSFPGIVEKYGSGTVKSLIDKGFLSKVEREVNPLKSTLETGNPEKLSPVQSGVLDSIKENFKKLNVVLLHGVTSSGKTEIYIHLIKEIIEKNQQVLYLLPEIALTAQIINRLRKVFGDEVGIYHSRFTDSERVAVYKKMSGIKGKAYKVVLGVRSAVFLPFTNLGLIIVDEEHENTYKQFDPAPRYNARDSAIFLASVHKAKVLLGTATPSIETYANCRSGKYGKIDLKERFGNIMLPEILISDIRDARKRKTMRSVFTPLLITEMQNALDRGKQIILFQNRRGFSSYLECESCGWIPKCTNCDVSQTYHKFSRSLVCHYCGSTIKTPSVCPECKSTNIVTRGFGTELVEDEIGLIFPDIKVARLDMDTSRTRNSYERILDDFGKGKNDVLVGTQILSKGLDFDNVSLVGILNADQMLNYPDFRAYERSFQLMAQVSGRAGRKDARGKVIIQTSDPANQVIKFVKENDFESMYTSQINERQAFSYPPFVKLIKVSLKHKENNQLQNVSAIVADKMRKVFGKRVFGPQSPLIGRISNYYIMDILLKVEKQSSFKKARQLLRDILVESEKAGALGTVKIIIDVDPF